MSISDNQAKANALVLRFKALPPNVQGVLWLLASAILFTAMSALAKVLGDRLHAFQVSFFRALFGLVVVIPFLIRAGMPALKTARPGLQLIRTLTGSTAMLCGFYALVNLPLADAMAISFARSLFLVVLAIVFLREVVGPRRMIATLVGFAGVLIMLRPTGVVEPAALVAVLGALLVAMAAIFVKILSRTDSTITLLVYAGLMGCIVTGIPAAYNWTAPTLEELAWLFLMGAVGAAAHSCFIRGYAVGEATAITPIDYTRLIFAGIVGFLFFGDVPDAVTIGGALIIVSSSLYITYREARRGETPR